VLIWLFACGQDYGVAPAAECGSTVGDTWVAGRPALVVREARGEDDHVAIDFELRARDACGGFRLDTLAVTVEPADDGDWMSPDDVGVLAHAGVTLEIPGDDEGRTFEWTDQDLAVAPGFPVGMRLEWYGLASVPAGSSATIDVAALAWRDDETGERVQSSAASGWSPVVVTR
jgi:hypothetical protein